MLAATVLVPNAEADVASTVTPDADWIMSAVMTDGAIANYVDKQAVWPYLSNFAAMGLAKATSVTGNGAYLDAAWNWLRWYQAHENAQGFVTDYALSNGVMTSTNDMDSTDSYAGTFLLAAREAYRAKKDVARLNTLAAGVTGAVHAIEATQDVDGLTWAKPTWHVKYLMDQSEAYAGLLAAVDVATTMGNSALAQEASADASRMAAGVAKLWNTTTAAYDWAVQSDGSHVPTNWSLLYSDSLQQAWAVAFGLTSSTQGSTLLAKFNSSQPNWLLPAATAQFSSGPSTVGYWPVAGWGFGALGNPLAATAASDIRSGALAVNRAWPFTTGNAGELILLEAGFTLPFPGSSTSGSSTTTTTVRTTTTLAQRVKVVATTTTKATTTTRPKTTTTTKPPPSPTTTVVHVLASVGPVSASASVATPTTVNK